MNPRNPGKAARKIVVGQEEADIAKAIALSLKESETKRVALYPSTENIVVANETSASKKFTTKVRALYDFEAAEENELTFKAGEIIVNVDNSNENWWTGTNSRGQGMFPAQFVTTDIDAKSSVDKSKDTFHKIDTQNKQQFDLYSQRPLTPVIDESKIDACINLIEQTDPTGETGSDSAELLKFEAQCRQMGPLIDQELEKIDKRYNNLLELNKKIMHSFQMYNQLMTQGGMARPNNYMWHPQTTVPGNSYYSMPNDQSSLSMSAMHHQQTYHVPQQQPSVDPMRFQTMNYQSAVESVQNHAPGASQLMPTDTYSQPSHMCLDKDKQLFKSSSSSNNNDNNNNINHNYNYNAHNEMTLTNGGNINIL